MSRRQVYAIDLAGVPFSVAKMQAATWTARPIEVAECVECGHVYLFHFRVPVGIDPAGVGCIGCGPDHRCARDTTSIDVAYYPKHDDAD